MKIRLQKSVDRGHTQTNWLDSRHSFSFGNYHDISRMNFGKLRVLNDDIIAPGAGFGMHPHSNMEIISIALEGELEHKDGMGNHGVIKTGEMQRMSAGSGIIHSEFNPSKKKDARFLQIWIDPEKKDAKPQYEQGKFDNNLQNAFAELIAKNSKSSMKINQDAKLMIGKFEKGKVSEIKTSSGKGLFIFVIDGKLKMGNVALEKADSAEIIDASKVRFDFLLDSRILVIEVPV